MFIREIDGRDVYFASNIISLANARVCREVAPENGDPLSAPLNVGEGHRLLRVIPKSIVVKRNAVTRTENGCKLLIKT